MVRSKSRKFLINWYFLQVHESQRLWIFQLFKVQEEIPTSTAPNPWVGQEVLLDTQRPIGKGAEADWVFSPDFDMQLPNALQRKTSGDFSYFFFFFLAYSPSVFILTKISCFPSHLHCICRGDFSIWPGYYQKMRTSCSVRRTPLLSIKVQRFFLRSVCII